jgi:hypothetical protein
MVRAWLFPVALVGLAWGVLGLALMAVARLGTGGASSQHSASDTPSAAERAAELAGHRRALISAVLLGVIALVSAGLAVSVWP